MPATNSVAILASTLFERSLGQFHLAEAFVASPLAFMLLLLFYGPVPEELGWRGYGLDSLRTRFNLLTSSLILATFWAI
ncbi:MAG: CPBP family intramembrane glutamic endopeptidase [Chloroflexota bacterium]